MIPIIYRSSDGGAPVLTGAAGTLVALLDACLVNGYGAKAAAGWTKPFAAANRGAYRGATGVRHFLDVLDTGPGVGGVREARVTGFETMSAIGVGTQAFGNLSAFAAMRKSNTIDATARPWILIADDRTFYLFVNDGSIAVSYTAMCFGEFFSYVAADAARSILCARNAELATAVTGTQEALDHVSTSVAAISLGQIPRGYTGLGAAVTIPKFSDPAKSGGAANLLGIVPFPNPPDGGLYVSPMYIGDTNTVPANHVRGVMRGFFHQLHPVASFADGDVFQGAGDYAGREFLMIKLSIRAGIYCIETTEWDVSA